jgi:signal transduction histidine kinase
MYLHQSRNAQQSIPAGRITHLKTDPDGNLHIGSFMQGYGVYQTKEGSIHTIHSDWEKVLKPTHNWIAYMLCDTGKTVWISTASGLIRMYNGKIKSIYSKENGFLKDRNPGPLAKWKPGILLLGSMSGLIVLDVKKGISYDAERPGPYSRLFAHETQKNKSDAYAINEIYCDKGGGIWVAYWYPKLIYFAPGKPGKEYLIDGPWKQNYASLPSSFVEDPKGNMWIGTLENGLFCKVRGKDSLIHYNHIPGDPHALMSRQVRDLLQDKAGNLWIASDKGVSILQNAEGPFKAGEVLKELGIEGFQTACAADSGRLIIADKEGIKVLNREKRIVNKYEYNKKGYHGEVWRMKYFNQGLLFVGKDSSMCMIDLKNGKVNHFERFGFLKKKNAIIHFIQENDSIFWICGWWWNSNNFFRYNLVKDELMPVSLPFADNNGKGHAIWNAHFKKDGKLRVFSNVGYADLDPGTLKVEKYVQGYFGSANIRTGNRILGNTNGEGIFDFDLDEVTLRKHTRENGLPANQIDDFYLDEAKKECWMLFKSGLVKMDLSSNRFTSYDAFHFPGVRRTNPNVLIPCGDTAMMFTDNQRFYYLDKRVSGESKPLGAPVISSVRISGKEINTRTFMALPDIAEENNTISIHFSAMIFSGEHHPYYRYRLKEGDEAWRMASEDGSVNLFELPAGKYVFEAQYSFDRTLWSASTPPMSFEIIKPFYKRTWFIVMIIGAVVATGFLVYMNINRRKWAIQNLRNEISRDLHDEVGSTLSSISMMSAGLKMSLHKNPEHAEKVTEQIGSNAEKMLGVMDDIVWSINPGADSLNDMVVRMKEQGYQMCENYEIELSFNTQPEELPAIKMPMVVRKNVFLIFKELLNNACKHSGSRQIKVNLTYHDPYLNLEICDYGKGFDPDTPRSRNGMRILKQRAEEAGAEFKISSDSHGTRANLRVKASP